jgi:hypothetical protein
VRSVFLTFLFCLSLLLCCSFCCFILVHLILFYFIFLYFIFLSYLCGSLTVGSGTLIQRTIAPPRAIIRRTLPNSVVATDEVNDRTHWGDRSQNSSQWCFSY